MEERKRQTDGSIKELRSHLIQKAAQVGVSEDVLNETGIFNRLDELSQKMANTLRAGLVAQGDANGVAEFEGDPEAYLVLDRVR